jgi:type I restriction enzyme S subunit
MTRGPYTLPKGWRWVRLGEVCDVERKTLDPRRFPEKEFFVYSIPAYDKNESPELLKGAEIGSAKLVIEPGVCLFSKLNPRIPRAWAIREDPPVPNTTLLASTEFMPLRPHSQLLDLEYLRTLLLSDIFLNQVRTDVTGATGSRQRLRTEIVLDAFIPLPPLEEQRRIVARIEELMGRVREARRLREEAKNDAERLWQAILAQTFPRPGSELPEGWRWAKLGEVSEIIMGQSPPSKSYNTEGKGLPFFQGKADFGDLYPIPRVWCGDPKKIAHAGDILISVRAPVGPTNMAAEDCCIGRGLAALRPRNGIDPFWVLFYLRSIEGVIAVMGTGSTFNAITKKELEALFIPLPPLEEQRRIVAHLQEVQEKIKALEEAQEQTEAELKRLEQAILEKAFRGEL